MQFVWAAALGKGYFAIRRKARAAIVLALCVPSHWLLDYISDRPDMPLVPGGAHHGLALWNSLPATLIAERSGDLFTGAVGRPYGVARQCLSKGR
jgi:hypothetical protein